MMIAISILSIMMIFLYQSNASVNKSNQFYAKEVGKLKICELKKKIIFLDFSLMVYKSDAILPQDKKEDIVFIQSTNSMHRRVNPYIAYIVKNKKLYRLESLKKFKEYPLGVDSEFDVDYLGEVNSFRVYKQKKRSTSSQDVFLVHIDFKNEDDILLKIRTLNEY